MTILDIVYFPILITLSGYGAYRIGRNLGLRYKLSLSLFLWHTAFCMYYWFYAQNNVADANNYYDVALSGLFNWFPGTSFVESFTALFVSGLGFGKLNTYLVFNMFGVSGLLLLAHVLLTSWPVRHGGSRYVPYLLLLMPGLSFWSAAIGKDAPAFLAACLASYAFLDVNNRKIFFILAVLIMFVVRPHVAAFMLLAACIALLTGRNISFLSRFSISSLLIASIVIALPFVIKFVGLSDVISGEAIGDYFDQRQGYNMEGGGGVDIASLPLPLKIFTYLFRPLFFDAPGLLGAVVSFENLFLLTVVILYVARGFYYLVRNSSVTVRYNLFYLAISLFIFSMTTANLGIAIRQKTMILPSFLFLTAFTANQVFKKRQARLSRAASRRVMTRRDSLTFAAAQVSNDGVS